MERAKKFVETMKTIIENFGIAFAIANILFFIALLCQGGSYHVKIMVDFIEKHWGISTALATPIFSYISYHYVIWEKEKRARKKDAQQRKEKLIANANKMITEINHIIPALKMQEYEATFINAAQNNLDTFITLSQEYKYEIENNTGVSIHQLHNAVSRFFSKRLRYPNSFIIVEQESIDKGKAQRQQLGEEHIKELTKIMDYLQIIQNKPPSP
ncbi:MAG: hypothetical protein GY804_06290 [Alphaproteobacteria bacterium]|nr:hypothetical protein [Alphaproteobacteria bacterium]